MILKKSHKIASALFFYEKQCAFTYPKKLIKEHHFVLIASDNKDK